jgi:hypothetical protein
MTNEEMNRYVADRMGWCWHSIYPPNDTRYGYCRHCGKHQSEWDYKDNPDFSTKSGTVDLLGLMMKRDDASAFFGTLVYGYDPEEDEEELIPCHIVTTSGALLEAVYGWFKERERNERDIPT